MVHTLPELGHMLGIGRKLAEWETLPPMFRKRDVHTEERRCGPHPLAMLLEDSADQDDTRLCVSPLTCVLLRWPLSTYSLTYISYWLFGIYILMGTMESHSLKSQR